MKLKQIAFLALVFALMTLDISAIQWTITYFDKNKTLLSTQTFNVNAPDIINIDADSMAAMEERLDIIREIEAQVKGDYPLKTANTMDIDFSAHTIIVIFT